MQIYLVGGAVRDQLLNLPVYERDWVVVGATPQDLLKQGYRQVGKDFPVFIHPESREEYALARTERKTVPGHTGFSVHSSPQVSLEDDLMRRDLTINAMAQDEQGKIIDPYNGRQDLTQRILRHVSPAFSEDPLRIFRVARFAAKLAHLNFTIAKDTAELMLSLAESDEITHLSRERIWQETKKALATNSPEVYFKTLLDCNALTKLNSQFANVLLKAANSQQFDKLKLIKNFDSRYICLLTLCASDNSHIVEDIVININAFFGVPTSLAKSSELVVKYYFSCIDSFKLANQEILDLLISLDAFRRTERSLEVLNHMKAVAIILAKENTHDLEFLEKIIPTLASIKLEPNLQKSLDGQEIGMALNQLRYQAIGSLKQSYK